MGYGPGCDPRCSSLSKELLYSPSFPHRLSQRLNLAEGWLQEKIHRRSHAGLQPQHPPPAQHQVKAEGAPPSPSASGHSPSTQNPVRTPVINWLPGTTPKLALYMLTWKDTLLSERNNVPFFLCVFCIVAYKYTCNGILNELNSVKYNHVSALFPTTAFTQAALNSLSHHPSHDVSSRSHRFLVTFRWKESHIGN